MPVVAIDHINLHVPDNAFMRVHKFYCEILGLVPGRRPNFLSKGCWLYAGNKAIVHLVRINSLDADTDREPGLQLPVDHIALRCGDFNNTVERLSSAGMVYSINKVSVSGNTQILLREPSGLRLELVFDSSEFAE